MEAVFHVRGRNNGVLGPAQDTVEDCLQIACADNNIQFESKRYTVSQFVNLLETSGPNTLIYYDGHGNIDGCIFLSDGSLTGDDIRRHRRQAIVVLHCGFSAHIATIEPYIATNLRSTVATLLAVGNDDNTDCSSEVNQIFTEMRRSYVHMIDSEQFAHRIATQIKRLGLQRMSMLYNGLCPLSIGQLDRRNDHIFISTITEFLYHNYVY